MAIIRSVNGPMCRFSDFLTLTLNLNLNLNLTLTLTLTLTLRIEPGPHSGGSNTFSQVDRTYGSLNMVISSLESEDFRFVWG